MRREDKVPDKDREWAARSMRARIAVRCRRRDHVITINDKGRIHLEGHNGLPLSAVLQEHRLSKSDEKLQGCYYFIHFLLCFRKARPSDLEMPSYRSRRTAVLARLAEAGVDETVARSFLRLAICRRNHRAYSRQYVDEFGIPFTASARHRIDRVYASQREREEQKKTRICVSLAKQGFMENEHAYLLRQYRW